MSPNRIGIEEARGRLGDIVTAAQYDRVTTVITRNGRDAAAVVPLHLARATYTLISAVAGDHAPGVEISDPSSPLDWEDLPAHAQEWARSQGYDPGEPVEVLYVAPGTVDVPGWPTLTLAIGVPSRPDDRSRFIRLKGEQNDLTTAMGERLRMLARMLIPAAREWMAWPGYGDEPSVADMPVTERLWTFLTDPPEGIFNRHTGVLIGQDLIIRQWIQHLAGMTALTRALEDPRTPEAARPVLMELWVARFPVQLAEVLGYVHP